jgi:hypothetical protein
LGYNHSINSSHSGIGHAPAVRAARGFLMPNYTTNGG